MGDSAHQYADIREVRNVGRRKANLLLREDWILLDWVTEQSIQSRELPGHDGQPTETLYFKTQSIQYIVGRPHNVVFTSDDLYDAEQEELRQRRDRRQGGGDAEGM